MFERSHRWLAAFLVFAAAFALVLCLTLPLDLVAERFVFPLISRRTGLGIAAAATEWRPPLSLSLRDVRLALPVREGEEQRFDEVRLTPGWAVLLARRAGAATLTLGQGRLECASDGRRLRIEGRQLALDRLALLRNFLGWQVQGSLDFTGDLTPATDQEPAAGAWRFTAHEVLLRNVTLLGLKLPEIRLQEIDGEAKISKGTLQITRFTTRGGNAAVSMNGGVLLARPLGQSVCNLLCQVRLSEGLERELGASASLLTMARKPDGNVNLSLSGPLVAPALNVQ